MIKSSKIIHECFTFDVTLLTQCEVIKLQNLNTEFTKIIRVDEVFGSVVIGLPNPSLDPTNYRIYRNEVINKLTEIFGE